MNTTTMEAITLPESKRLKELEATIEDGQEAWLAVGLALTEIRDKKLFRSEFETFKEYCEQTWGWSDKRAYQLIAAADESSTSGRTFGSEREARNHRKVRQTPAKPAPVVKESFTTEPAAEPAPRTLDAALIESTGIDKGRIADVLGKSEPAVTLYYTEAEMLWNTVKANATDKQLNSFSVFAAQLPALVKEEKRKRGIK